MSLTVDRNSLKLSIAVGWSLGLLYQRMVMRSDAPKLTVLTH